MSRCSPRQRAPPEGIGHAARRSLRPGRPTPAAWALVEASYEGQVLGRGIADERGCVNLIFAYPPPVDFEPLSPLITGAAIWQHTMDATAARWVRAGDDSSRMRLISAQCLSSWRQGQQARGASGLAPAEPKQ